MKTLSYLFVLISVVTSITTSADTVTLVPNMDRMVSETGYYTIEFAVSSSTDTGKLRYRWDNSTITTVTTAAQSNGQGGWKASFVLYLGKAGTWSFIGDSLDSPEGSYEVPAIMYLHAPLAQRALTMPYDKVEITGGQIGLWSFRVPVLNATDTPTVTIKTGVGLNPDSFSSTVQSDGNGGYEAVFSYTFPQNGKWTINIKGANEYNGQVYPGLHIREVSLTIGG